MREQRGREIDFPTFCLHFDDPADHQVADFRGVAGAQGGDGEEFVGAGEGSREGGEDGGGGACVGGGVRVGAVAAHPLRVRGDELAGGDYGFCLG